MAPRSRKGNEKKKKNEHGKGGNQSENGNGKENTTPFARQITRPRGADKQKWKIKIKQRLDMQSYREYGALKSKIVAHGRASQSHHERKARGQGGKGRGV